jgi:hypothetical protein
MEACIFAANKRLRRVRGGRDSNPRRLSRRKIWKHQAETLARLAVLAPPEIRRR